MSRSAQAEKARTLLALHHDPKLLVLPNIWDPLGARLLESLGYPAAATASAAVAFSLGYDDGQRIPFDTMLDVIDRIAERIDIPLTADVERGFADTPGELAENVKRVLRAGAVGINLEDSLVEGGELLCVESQVERLRAAREAADEEGISLVINARIDVYLREGEHAAEEKLEEAVVRGRAYREAGADCLFPIGVRDVETLRALHFATRSPINVFAREGTASMRELETAGVARLSVGPGLLEASLGRMKQVATELANYGSYEGLARDAISSAEIAALVTGETVPDPGR